MPLRKSTKRTEYLNNYLESGDVSDVIEWGKDKYPVDALCSDHRFVDALNFVRRGYRMMHDGCFAQEFFDILYSLEVESRILSSGQNSRTAKEQLKQCLIDEFEQFHDYEPYILGEEFAFRLHDDTGRYMKLINSVRKDFPLVYSELLKCNTMSDHFIPILLLCNDMTLVRDFAKGITKPEVYKESVSEFGDDFSFLSVKKRISMFRLCSDAPEVELTRGLDVFRIFEFANDNTWQALNLIMRYQPTLIPHDLYWKLAVLITVRRMRKLVDEGDSFLEKSECADLDEDTVRKLCPAAENILEDMELMLRTYMPEINDFDLFAGEGGILQAVINLCGYPNHEIALCIISNYDMALREYNNHEMDSEDFTLEDWEKPHEMFTFEDWEKPHECDIMVLKRAVNTYCKGDASMLHDYVIATYREAVGYAKEWRDWYIRMNSMLNAPHPNDFYIDKYQMFFKYADLFLDYDVLDDGVSEDTSDFYEDIENISPEWDDNGDDEAYAYDANGQLVDDDEMPS